MAGDEMQDGDVSCYCHQALLPLQGRLAEAFAPGGAPDLLRDIEDAALARAVGDWLGARALPAPEWQPDPAWQHLVLPSVRLSASAMATVSAMAQLRAQALAQFGMDLLEPLQARPFARLVATLQARAPLLMSAELEADAATMRAWSRLASLQDAVRAVKAALEQRGLPAPGSVHPQAAVFAQHQAFQPMLRSLGQLSPLLAASRQLGVDTGGHFTAELAARLRVLRALPAPVRAAPPGSAMAMAQLTAGFSAVARLRAGLGVDALKIGLPAARAMVAAQAAPVLRHLRGHLGLPPVAAMARQAEDALLAEAARALARLPPTPYCPSLLANGESVAAAASVHAAALAEMDWSVPALVALPAVGAGLSAVSFAAQLQAATGVDAVRRAPCGAGCDAAALARAA